MKRDQCRVWVIAAFLLSCIPAVAQRNLQIGPSVQASSASGAQIRALKVTLLSTMLVAEPIGFGEWGFSALVEADGHRILVDTGAHPETVLQNARDLNIDLSDVQEVVLTHNHDDHVTGLFTLRREMMKKNPAALSVVHVAKGIFYSRPSAQGESNPMIAIRKAYEATGGRFVEHSDGADIFPGAWLTGPVRGSTRSVIGV
jgi:7,8-dihydropterin-6-yl-methyl-4-(beta-D-ribofuranosyl)aminobenzene 5'-phosphate synthase